MCYDINVNTAKNRKISNIQYTCRRILFGYQTFCIMTTKKDPTRPQRAPVTRMVENFHLVWLDGSIDGKNDDDYLDSINKLREVVNTFTDVDKESGFMIVSEDFKQNNMKLGIEIVI